MILSINIEVLLKVHGFSMHAIALGAWGCMEATTLGGVSSSPVALPPAPAPMCDASLLAPRGAVSA